ncbi:MAG: metallophosphoesterase [Chloroflexi bacterium]|nr:metallophosphoesterase [Chloroflexota bacterium]
MLKFAKIAFLISFILTFAACQAQGGTQPEREPATSPIRTLASILSIATQTPAPSTTPDILPVPEDALLFAVIGDYGQDGSNDAFLVAEMIDSWKVDFIITTGDNNYPDGEAETIDDNIGQFYHRYIGDYQGEYNRGSETNRFFPSLGNHDWSNGTIDAYLNYFTLPGNERYYDVVQGPVHFFILDSDSHEPDGVGLSSDQAAWLQEAMQASTAPWQIVVMHHPPYSSGMHGSSDWMQWPYVDWGADAVLSGHDHLYERLGVAGLTYFTNGLGGHASVYDFVNILPESQFRYNELHGAMRVQATEDWVLFEFINIEGAVVDRFVLEAANANP